MNDTSRDRDCIYGLEPKGHSSVISFRKKYNLTQSYVSYPGVPISGKLALHSNVSTLQ